MVIGAPRKRLADDQPGQLLPYCANVVVLIGLRCNPMFGNMFARFSEIDVATGWAGDGAVQDQIDATVDDAVKRARQKLGHGPGLLCCEECDAAIPEARRKAVPGVRLCIACQEARDREQASTLYNRRGSKDSQLR